MPHPQPGQFVKLRQRFGRVSNVVPHHSDMDGVTALVEVSYLDPWAYPESDKVVWHIEESNGAKLISSLTLPNPIEGQADDPADLQAMVDACRWTALDRLPEWSPDPLSRAQHTPLAGVWHSAVEPEDYQLVPVMKALSMPRVTLLLADDVGLGKTVEAGLTLSEMFNRRRIRRVLVLCPAGLQHQWQEELHDKFHLDFEVMDSRMVDRLRKEEGFDTNPWMIHPRLITSMDFLKQEGIKDQFLEASRRFSQEGQSLFPGFDLLIVDEAHNLAPNALGDDSQRTQLLRALLPCFEHRLFLTATPHNGQTRAFTGLLELLDPVRFHQDDTFPVAAQQQLQLVMVRRLKKEINAQSLEPRFKDRHIEAITLPAYGPGEARLWTALRAYREQGLAILGRLGRREQHVGRFMFTLLTKRALSSSYAFARTWWSHMEGLEGRAKTQSLREDVALQEARAAQRQAEREADNEAARNLWEQEALMKGARWLSTVANELLVPAAEVSAALETLGWTRAKTARALDEDGSAVPMSWPAKWPEDARWVALKAWISKHLLTPAGGWTEERLILFTEYRDTLDYLRARLDAEGFKTPRVEELHGASDAKDRDRIKKLFNNPLADLRVMVATDAASEGLNFQESCRYVIHQELPWSPTKLEQRNGRVDRHGQFRDVVAHHFVSDQDEDLAFLDLLARKVHTVREELGSVGQILDAAVTQHFLGEKKTAKGLLDAVEGRVTSSTSRADMQGADHGSRDVLQSTQRQLKAMERQMGWSPDRVRRVLERATLRARGTVASVPHRPGHFTFQEPKAWEDMVKISLLNDKGERPYLVFDPTIFEKHINGVRSYRNEPDSLLLRLGHPILRRAVHEILGRVHDEATHRWTLGASELPPGVGGVLILHAELRAQNELRENLHHEIVSIPFQWAGDHLVPLEPGEWEPYATHIIQPLNKDRAAALHHRLNQVWTRLEGTLAESLKRMESKHLALLAERAKVWKTELAKEGKAQFEARLKEIADNLSEKGIKRLEEKILVDQRELIAARQQSQSLFEEFELERQEQLLTLENDLVAREQRVAFLEQRKAELVALQDQLKQAQDRWLNKILPKRYAIPPGGLSVLPLAFEVRVGG